jgi:toxin ParE1/3/4
MSLSFQYSDYANRDLAEIIHYLEVHARPAGAEQFVNEVDRAVAFLCEMPGAGGRCDFLNKQWPNLRHCVLKKFRSYVIYYQVEGGVLQIVRIIHAARDRDAIFGR